jgi:putative flippase GtrA
MSLLARPVVRFAGVGVACTIAFALLFVVLSGPLGAMAANAVALATTAVANTAANRRLTFGLRGRGGLARDHLRGAGVYVVTLGMTSGAMALLHAWAPAAPLALQAAVLAAASTGATVTRYLALRSWVFRRARIEIPGKPVAAG